jgi:hypothetical protein
MVDEYLTFSGASKHSGLNRATIRRRVEEGVLPVYLSPADRRRRLVKVSDLDRLMEPVPVQSVAKEGSHDVAA